MRKNIIMHNEELEQTLDSYFTSLITHWRNCELAFNQIKSSIENNKYKKYFYIYFVDESQKYFDRRKSKNIDDWENITLLFSRLIKMLAMLNRSNPISELKNIDFPERIKNQVLDSIKDR